jgi:tetratricopeptide (TPR) repeat protein
LLLIGGALIGVSLLLAFLLRVLLVPSEDTAVEESGGETRPAAVTTSPAQTPMDSGSQADSAIATSSVTPSRQSDSVAAEPSVESYFEEALSALDTGRLKEARTNFLKVLEIDPQNTRAKTRLSLLEEEIESQAERHFTNARQAFNFLRYDEAIAEWEMFLTLVDPSDSRYGEAQKGIEQARAKLR